MYNMSLEKTVNFHFTLTVLWVALFFIIKIFGNMIKSEICQDSLSCLTLSSGTAGFYSNELQVSCMFGAARASKIP